MEIPEGLLYSDQHVWLRPADGTALIGLTDFAQQSLGELMYVDLSATGQELAVGDEAAMVESCKTAAGVASPVRGRVLRVNPAVAKQPTLINESPYGDGWLLELRLADASNLDGLMDARQYRAYLGEG